MPDAARRTPSAFPQLPDWWAPVAVAALLLLSGWTIYVLQMGRLEARSRSDAMARADELAQAYAADVASTVNLVAGMMRFVAAYAGENGAPQAVRMVAEHRLYSGLIGKLGVVDARGRGTAIGPDGETPLDISDRPYFRAALATDDVVIGAPVIAKTNKHPSVPFGLRVRRSDGRLLGVVATVIELKSFSFESGAWQLGSNGVLAVVGTRDRKVRTRISPAAMSIEPGLIGAPDSRLWSALAASPVGSFWQPGSPDHLLRAYAYR